MPCAEIIQREKGTQMMAVGVIEDGSQVETILQGGQAGRIWTGREALADPYWTLHTETVPEGRQGIHSYFGFYNDDRLHQALKYRTPAEVYFQRAS